MITGFLHFAYSCADADRSIAFYRDNLGMELVADRVVPGGGYVEAVTGIAGARVRIVHLQGYGFNLELLEYEEPRGDTRAREPNHAGSAHMAFVVDDCDAVCAELAAKGVPVRSAERAPPDRDRRPERRREVRLPGGSRRQSRSSSSSSSGPGPACPAD